MMDDDRDARVTASEPVARAVENAAPAGGAAAHGQTPREVAETEDGTDAATAGDGIAFFEGGDGREDARGDIERSG